MLDHSVPGRLPSPLTPSLSDAVDLPTLLRAVREDAERCRLPLDARVAVPVQVRDLPALVDAVESRDMFAGR
jgi:hypothetical protein